MCPYLFETFKTLHIGASNFVLFSHLGIFCLCGLLSHSGTEIRFRVRMDLLLLHFLHLYFQSIDLSSDVLAAALDLVTGNTFRAPTDCARSYFLKSTNEGIMSTSSSTLCVARRFSASSRAFLAFSAVLL